MGLLIAIVSVAWMVFDFYGRLPLGYRTIFIYGTFGVSIAVFRAGFYYGWLKALMR